MILHCDLLDAEWVGVVFGLVGGGLMAKLMSNMPATSTEEARIREALATT